MISYQGALRRSKIPTSSPQEVAQIFVDHMNSIQRADAYTVLEEVVRAYYGAGTPATCLMVSQLDRIHDRLIRAETASALVNLLGHSPETAPGIGASDIVRLMVATRRNDTVREAFRLWARLDAAQKRSVDPHTARILVSAAKAKNHTSAPAAAAVLFLTTDVSSLRRAAAQRLGSELQERAQPPDVRYDLHERDFLTEDQKGRRYVDCLSMVAQSGQESYRYADRGPYEVLVEVTETLMGELSEYMTVEQARLLLTEFPPSWVVTARVMVAMGATNRCWPYAVGSHASYRALCSICALTNDAAKLSPPRFPLDVHTAQKTVPMLIDEADALADTESSLGLRRALGILTSRGMPASAPEQHDLPPYVSSLRNFRKALTGTDRDTLLRCGWNLMQDISGRIPVRAALADPDKEGLLAVLCDVLKRRGYAQHSQHVYGLYDIALELASGLGLSDAQVMSWIPAGSAKEAVRDLMSTKVAYPHAAMGAHIVRAVEAEARRRFPAADPAAVLSDLCSAPDDTVSIGEFLDMRSSLYAH